MLPLAYSTVLVVFLCLCAFAQSAFYVCPEPCMAKYLPQDMNTENDCLCSKRDIKTTGTSENAQVQQIEQVLEGIYELFNHQPAAPSQTSSQTSPHRSLLGGFRCPEHSAAKVVGPKSFADCVCDSSYTRDTTLGACVNAFTCQGRYKVKKGIKAPTSIADCDCELPYTKDDQTGDCALNHCPRAGNYVRKSNRTAIHSLADCTCRAPLIKNEQSGECYSAFQCPVHSTPPSDRPAKSFADCLCSFGFVRSENACVHEKPAYRCPPNSAPTDGLVRTPNNFKECKCEDGFSRQADVQSCVAVPTQHSTDGTMVPLPDKLKIFDCPQFSIALTMFPYGMMQCMCLPGFLPNNEMETCDWDPDAYSCPAHSYNPHPDVREVEFAQCTCAKGYVRNEMKLTCQLPESPADTVNKMLVPLKPSNMTQSIPTTKGPFQCPADALVRRWPLHDLSDCECINGQYDKFPCEQLRIQKGLILGTHGRYSCPKNMVINSWPVRSVDDCSCKYGYRRSHEVDTCLPIMPVHCPNHTKASITEALTVQDCVCEEGRTLCPQDNTCKYAPERVRPYDNSPKQQLIVLNGNEMEYEIIEDDILITQGDIAVGKSFGFHPGNEEKHIYQLHGYYNNERDHRWNDASMCYALDASLSKSHGSQIQNAMKHISMTTGFSFVDCHGDCSPYHHCQDNILISPTESGCFSYIGRIGGPQKLGLSNECQTEGQITHLLLHAIGLHHPTARADRNEHVDIAWECVAAKMRSSFAIEERNTPNVPYDFYSIMHPSHAAFVDTRQPDCLTIFPRIANFEQRQHVQSEMGQRDQLSLTDIHYVWSLYPQLKTPTQKHQFHSKSFSKLHHVSHVHTQSETRKANVSRTQALIGPVVCIVGFVVFVALIALEMHRRKYRGQDLDDDYMYSDPLLQDSLYEG